jgi:hypothetical protein
MRQLLWDYCFGDVDDDIEDINDYNDDLYYYYNNNNDETNIENDVALVLTKSSLEQDIEKEEQVGQQNWTIRIPIPTEIIWNYCCVRWNNISSRITATTTTTIDASIVSSSLTTSNKSMEDPTSTIQPRSVVPSTITTTTTSLLRLIPLGVSEQTWNEFWDEINYVANLLAILQKLDIWFWLLLIPIFVIRAIAEVVIQRNENNIDSDGTNMNIYNDQLWDVLFVTGVIAVPLILISIDIYISYGLLHGIDADQTIHDICWIYTPQFQTQGYDIEYRKEIVRTKRRYPKRMNPTINLADDDDDDESYNREMQIHNNINNTSNNVKYNETHSGTNNSLNESIPSVFSNCCCRGFPTKSVFESGSVEEIMVRVIYFRRNDDKSTHQENNGDG